MPETAMPSTPSPCPGTNSRVALARRACAAELAADERTGPKQTRPLESRTALTACLLALTLTEVPHTKTFTSAKRKDVIANTTGRGALSACLPVTSPCMDKGTRAGRRERSTSGSQQERTDSTMTVRPRFRHTRKALLTLAAAATLALGGRLAGGSGTPARAAAQGPCDIYASGGTPCVAAHSTTRALYAAYNGPLYQVRRASDNATTNISPLSAGGVANAATQDSFCAGTSCVITEIFDQTGRGNTLTDAPGGGAAGGPDNLANATAAPISVGGHKAYGVFVAPGTGYRIDGTSGIATGDQAEGEYAI